MGTSGHVGSDQKCVQLCCAQVVRQNDLIPRELSCNLCACWAVGVRVDSIWVVERKLRATSLLQLHGSVGRDRARWGRVASAHLRVTSRVGARRLVPRGRDSRGAGFSREMALRELELDASGAARAAG